MKKFILTLTALLLLSFVSCNKGALPPKVYSSAFVCEYSFVEGEKLYRLRLEADSIDAEKERTARLYYLEPSTMVGVVCEYKNGEYSAVCGEAELFSDSAKALFESAEPFLASGKIEFVGKEKINGEYSEHYRVSGNDILSSVYIDGKSGKPQYIRSSVCGRNFEISVISFEER